MLRCSNNYVPLCRLIETEMPRQARKVSGTGIYHVMLRGINRQDIFENRSENRPLIYGGLRLCHGECHKGTDPLCHGRKHI